jgi:hypothetical protein
LFGVLNIDSSVLIRASIYFGVDKEGILNQFATLIHFESLALQTSCCKEKDHDLHHEYHDEWNDEFVTLHTAARTARRQ